MNIFRLLLSSFFKVIPFKFSPNSLNGCFPFFLFFPSAVATMLMNMSEIIASRQDHTDSREVFQSKFEHLLSTVRSVQSSANIKDTRIQNKYRIKQNVDDFQLKNWRFMRNECSYISEKSTHKLHHTVMGANVGIIKYEKLNEWLIVHVCVLLFCLVLSSFSRLFAGWHCICFGCHLYENITI